MIAASNRRPMSISCSRCGAEYSVMVNPEDVIRWQAGHGYIQEVMPYLSASEREMFISGTCDTCWNNLFGSDDEE
jgi:hypothetical protein